MMKIQNRLLLFIIGGFFLLPLSAAGVVDTRSAGYSKTFVDFKSTEPGYPFSIVRTYSSRSLFNGLFGFGWCSNIETRLAELPDGTIKSVECGGGMEIIYHMKGKVPNVQLIVAKIVKEVQKKRKLSSSRLKKLKRDLLQSQTLRADFLNALGIKGKARRGTRYYARGRLREYIVATSRGFVRYLPSGAKEHFNQEGYLVKVVDSAGVVTLDWKPTQITLTDNRGRRLVVLIPKKGGKVKTVKWKRRVVASYQHKNEDLVKATNSYGETFGHGYDGYHNLITNVYPDKKTEHLTYNVKKDWVTSFTDRRNCKETYGYGVNKKNPDHYFSTVQKVCGRKIVVKSKYEFWHKTRPKGGGKYLRRARVRTNGRLKTDVIYHPVFNTPVSYFRDGLRTARSYYGSGFLKEKDNKFQNVKYSQYNQKCRKPELVTLGYKNPGSNNPQRLVRTENIQFQFDGKCQLMQARKSNDEWIKVRHNHQGQIVYMEDQSRKKVSLTWHKTLNKPEVITREGVGSLRLVYNSQGNVVDVKSLKSGPTVITQVASVFNSFLKTLSPVSSEMVIL